VVYIGEIKDYQNVRLFSLNPLYPVFAPYHNKYVRRKHIKTICIDAS